MQRYRPYPQAPHELTAAELKALDAAPIDYSDIPLLGDDFFARVQVAWPPAKHQPH